MEQLYFKYKNSFGPNTGTWWHYAKVIRDNGDGETCQVFSFERTSREHHYIAGITTPFIGSIDTNKYSYYCELYDPCTKEEFEKELELFMEDFNNWMSFIRCSP
jgi:hypothetical protein